MTAIANMNWREELTPEDTTALVALLAERFKVRMPRIEFSGRKRAGLYTPRKKTIRVSRQTQLWIVAHEFAHYLDHAETGRNIGSQANDHEWHSQGFYYKLRKVVFALGPGYPWAGEYKQIARWAAKDPAITDEHYFDLHPWPAASQKGEKGK